MRRRSDSYSNSDSAEVIVYESEFDPTDEVKFDGDGSEGAKSDDGDGGRLIFEEEEEEEAPLLIQNSFLLFIR